MLRKESGYEKPGRETRGEINLWIFDQDECPFSSGPVFHKQARASMPPLWHFTTQNVISCFLWNWFCQKDTICHKIKVFFRLSGIFESQSFWDRKKISIAITPISEVLTIRELPLSVFTAYLFDNCWTVLFMQIRCLSPFPVVLSTHFQLEENILKSFYFGQCFSMFNPHKLLRGL